MLAKLSMGALALNDVWFGGQTMNPWLLEEGSSGSSAGPGSATAAGLVGFSIGSETGGSIVSPSMRCGVTGLRPTFGRVPRSGAMTLCWSLDKLGPMTRTVEDAMLVLHAIQGADALDLTSVAAKLEYDSAAPIKGLRVGYFPAWMKEAPATDVDRQALDDLQEVWADCRAGIAAGLAVCLTEYDPVRGVRGGFRGADARSSCRPTEGAGPRRVAEYLPAVALSLRGRHRPGRSAPAQGCDGDGARHDARSTCYSCPACAIEMLTISNHTGHPSLTLRTGWVEVSETRSDWAPGTEYSSRKLASPHRVPHGITLIGRLFDEGTIARVGLALEQHYGVATQHPAGFGV